MTSPASVPGASANSKMSDADLAAGMFARKDTTQLEVGVVAKKMISHIYLDGHIYIYIYIDM